MARATLYHAHRADLTTGCCILSGNFGREIARLGEEHPLWFRETVLEQVRRQSYPWKPSRLAAAFCCDDLAAMHAYRCRHDPDASIYAVELVHEGAASHRADFNVVQPLPGRPESMEQIAHLYWTASLWTKIEEWPGVECAELLVASPLRILHRVNSVEDGSE